MPAGANKPLKSDYCSKPVPGRYNAETGTYGIRLCGKCRKCKKRQRDWELSTTVALMRAPKVPYRIDSLTVTPMITRCKAWDGEGSTCDCRKCIRYRQEMAEQEARQQQMVEAFTREIRAVYPGRSDFGDNGEGSSYLQNRRDQPLCLPIASVAQLLTKAAAENDDHPLSQDWISAPLGTKELYGTLLEMGRQELITGSPVARVRLPEVAPEKIEWLVKGNGCPLIKVEDGYATLLRDREPAENPRYPGCPQGVNPKAGKTMGEKLETAIAIVMASSWGKKLSHVDITRVINTAEMRELLDLGEYRYAGYNAVCEAIKKMVREGRIRRVRSAVHYRKNHHWAVESNAEYDPCFLLSPEHDRVVSGAVRAALTAKMEELRERLREEAA